MKVFILITVLIFNNIFSQTKPVETVRYVDITKYAGLWYEIAKIPNRFQKHCVKGTTAMYSIQEDGKISVLNSCIDKSGDVDEADGVARIVDKKTNAKLEVSFVSFFGWRPFWGDYWIIGLDENYQWAVIGHPEREYGWILSRTKKMDQETLDKVFNILIEQGYNKKDFEMSLH